MHIALASLKLPHMGAMVPSKRSIYSRESGFAAFLAFPLPPFGDFFGAVLALALALAFASPVPLEDAGVVFIPLRPRKTAERGWGRGTVV